MKKKSSFKKIATTLNLVALLLGQVTPVAADALDLINETATTTESNATIKSEEAKSTTSDDFDVVESDIETADEDIDSPIIEDGEDFTETTTVESVEEPTEETTEGSTSDAVINDSETTDSSTTASSDDDTISSTDDATTNDSTTDDSATSSTTNDSVTSDSMPPTNDATTSSETNASAAVTAPAQPLGPVVPALTGDALSIDLAALDLAAFSDSDLNGYELPLLSAFKNSQSAAIVWAAIQELAKPYDETGLKKDHYSNESFVRSIYQTVFDKTIDLTQQTKPENAAVGDLLIWKDKENISKIGISLGQDKVIMAVAPDKEAMETYQKAYEKDKEAKEPAGVQIFSIVSDEDKKDLYGETIAPAAATIPFDRHWALSDSGSELLKQYPATVDFRANDLTQHFVDQIGASARELGMKYDVFASVMIAQAILESGSGTSGLSLAPYNNLFGIKGSSQQAAVSFATQEDNGSGQLYTIQSYFRVYPTLADSLKDYVQLLRGGISGNDTFYKESWRSEAGNYLKATANLTGKYATDTSYHNKLNSIIAAYHLTQFDEPEEGQVVDFGKLANVPESYRKKVTFPVYNGVNYNLSGSYGSDQCTWYVFNRVAQLGGHVGDYMGNGADWGTTGKNNGYAVSNQPKAGDVISFKQGVAGYHPLYGHVGFVEAVTDDGVLISEGDSNYLNYRVIPNSIAQSSGVSYITPK